MSRDGGGFYSAGGGDWGRRLNTRWGYLSCRLTFLSPIHTVLVPTDVFAIFSYLDHFATATGIGFF